MYGAKTSTVFSGEEITFPLADTELVPHVCHMLFVTCCHMLFVTCCHMLSHVVTCCHMLGARTCLLAHVCHMLSHVVCHMLSHVVTCCLSHVVTCCHMLSHVVMLGGAGTSRTSVPTPRCSTPSSSRRFLRRIRPSNSRMWRA
jgi:hypothetical protein